MDLWEHSSGHLVGLIDKDATHIGVGYYRGYYVQQFAKNPDEKYTLTVDGNGGVFPSKGGVEKFEISVPARADVKLSTIDIPEKEGSNFIGWTEIDGRYNIESGLMYLDSIKNDVIHIYDNKTLKAHWSDSSDSSN